MSASSGESTEPDVEGLLLRVAPRKIKDSIHDLSMFLANFPAEIPIINTAISVTASGRLCEFIDT